MRNFFITLVIGGVLLASGICMHRALSHQSSPTNGYRINAMRSIAELQALGFGEHEPVIKALQVYHEACQADDGEGIYDMSQQVDIATLARVTQLTKQLLISYVEDAQRCHDLRLKPDDILIQFTHDKIIRLTIAFDELNRQLKNLEMPSWGEIQARLERMAEIAQQSVAHAKRDIARMARCEIAQNTSILSLLKAQISSKTMLLCDLHKEL